MATTRRPRRSDGKVPHAISTAEWQSYINRTSRRLLHISGKEFTQRWKGGYYKGSQDSQVLRVAMLLPLGGQDSESGCQ